MKSILIAAASLVLVASAGAATAQPRTRGTTVTTTTVHGPLKILPHHKKKLCQVRYVHHKRVKKCWYR